MFCPNCGKEVQNGVPFCPNCGNKLAVEPKPEPKSEVKPEEKPVPPVQQVVIQQAPITKDTLPSQFRPLSAWAYFGYSLLFSIPIVGFIFLIVFSFNGSNINRRSFARSYWCGFLLIAIFIVIVVLIGLATGGLSALSDWFNAHM